MREAGYDVRAVRELGLRDADDSEIWDYALANQAAIMTKDQDFAECLMSRRPAPVIIWLRIGNTSNRALVTWFLPLWPDIISRIEAGDNLVEVREKTLR